MYIHIITVQWFCRCSALWQRY